MKWQNQMFRVIGPMAALLVAAPSAQADLYVTAGYGGPTPYRLVHYDGNGRFVRGYDGLVESTDGLTSGPEGWLYAAGNILGGGYLARARPESPLAWREVLRHDAFRNYTIPGSITTGPDGSIYATSTGFRSDGRTGVFRYNPVAGSFTQIVDVPDPGLNNAGLPHALAVAPDGDVYLSRWNIGVERYSASTGQLVSVVLPASEASRGPAGMEFGPDGLLYLASAQGVDRYDPASGALIDQFIVNGAGGLSGAGDIEFGGGALYVNSPGARSILRYDALTGAFRDVFVAPDDYAQLGTFGARQMAFVVPEPMSAGVIGAGMMLLMLRSRRARQSAGG